MPNWCSNDLRVTGPVKELKRFKQFAEGTFEGQKEVLSADKFIPYPEEFKKQDELARKNNEKRRDLEVKLAKEGLSVEKAREKSWKDIPDVKDGFNSGGYHWCVKNWGTKWGICHAELAEEADFKDGSGELFYEFETAWSPATPVIKKMGKMFPLLEFDLRYFEQGAGFNGIFSMEKGKITQDKSGDYFGDRGG